MKGSIAFSLHFRRFSNKREEKKFHRNISQPTEGISGIFNNFISLR